MDLNHVPNSYHITSLDIIWGPIGADLAGHREAP